MSDTPPAQQTRAVILAAGVGRRLGGDGRPKCLLEFGGRSLLSRHLDALNAQGVSDITVVVGYEADRVRQAVGTRATCLLNPDFREGSVVSLWIARDVLRGADPLILMDADVIYDHRLMARLLTAKGNSLLLDRDLEPGDEPVKICISAGRIVDFHKRPQATYDWHGESVGFFRFAGDTANELAARCEDYVASGRRHMEYEEPIRDMILSSAPNSGAKASRFGFEDVTGLPWTEIDFAEDVQKAMSLLPEFAA